MLERKFAVRHPLRKSDFKKGQFADDKRKRGLPAGPDLEICR